MIRSLKLSTLILALTLPVVMLVYNQTFGSKQTHSVERGLLSAPDWRFVEDSPLVIAGEWQVIWGKLVGPTEFDANYQGDHAPIPGKWSQIEVAEINNTHGVATYRVRLDLPDYNRDLAFHMISPNATWRLYINEVLAGGNGTISDIPSQNVPNYTSRILPAQSGDSSLVLQVSNFSHAFGGPGHPITLWDRVALEKALGAISLYYVLVLGVLLAIGLFHLIFYMADRTDRQNGPVHLWFSVLCLIIAFRISGIIPHFHIYFPEAPYWSDLKLAYTSLFVAPAVYLLFFRSAFPAYFPEKLSKILIAVCLGMAVIVVITPETIYTHTRDFSIALNVSVILYTIVFTIMAMRDKQPGATAILISNYIFFLTAMNDAIIYTDNANGFDLTPFGVLVLGLGYSYALLLRLQRSFHQARETSGALEKLNLDLEKQVHDRTRSFEAAAARAENSAQERAQFIAAASHDLRQPLHALAMFNSALKRSSKDKAVLALIEKQESSISNLSDLLQDTLDTARAETNGKQPILSNLSVASLLTQLTTRFGAKAQRQNIQLKVASDAGDLMTDSGMLQRVLSNLIDNALKAARGTVSVSAKLTPAAWVFRITDDGRGIAREDASRIFESYVTMRDEAPGADGGYGLGLYVVKEFTRLLGGSIEIAMTSQTGSTFLLTLPHRAAVSAGERPAEARDPETLPSPGLRILAIDDEPEILDAMNAMLTSWGCDGRFAAGLAGARAHIADRFEPQILIVDYHLHASNGIEVIEALRRDLSNGVPALIITGATEASILAKIERSGLRVLPKPINPNQLAAHLAALLPDQ